MTTTRANCHHCEQDGEDVPASYVADVRHSQGYTGGVEVPVCDSHLDIAHQHGAIRSHRLMQG